MKTKQQEEGESTEKLVVAAFKNNGFWAYNLPKKIGGQPFDIIGCKRGITWFVDGKHLEADKASFSFERIEPNQRTSMQYARGFAGIQNLGFVIKWDRDLSRLFFLSYDKVIELEKNGCKSVKIEVLEDFIEVLNNANNN